MRVKVLLSSDKSKWELGLDIGGQHWVGMFQDAHHTVITVTLELDLRVQRWCMQVWFWGTHQRKPIEELCD